MDERAKTATVGLAACGYVLLRSGALAKAPTVQTVLELSPVGQFAAGKAAVCLLALAGAAVGAPAVPARGPNAGVKLVCTVLSAATVAYCAKQGRKRFLAQRGEAEWPEYFGLLCGLGAVAVAQVALLALHAVRRSGIFGEQTIQAREPSYERTFLGDALHHFSNPGAFILMLPYLCLTWMFRLMPDSYYDYDAPVDWTNVLLQLLVVDLFTFAFHVAEHCMPEFYKVSHKPHHRFVAPHFFNAFDGSLADTVALILFPLFTTAQLLHVHNWDYIAFGTVYSTHFMLIHCEFASPLDAVLELFMVNVAEDHHVHHAMFNSNFAHFFTIYDRLAGTYRSGASCKGFRSHAASLEKSARA